ncbi:PLP-dependent aminotransferase family protein [Aneurinibacillus migulanus]|uniref:aminotransferase-like domain-containing protein n=1 Tax=Aneurinibacillus migulanus TaxID=47500 RepID=UPI002E233D36|nr:PLP-dependent aminotransferase family protein [Aneurinibacillus migulanus]
MADLQWKPNSSPSIPLHKQIEEYIKEKILNGEWTVGTKIPSQRALAAAFGVNRSTVVTALDELTALGFIEGKSGGGTRVINNTWSLLTSTPPPDWNTYVKAGIHQPNLPTIQEINRAEFVPGVIRLGTGELSPELLPTDKMETIFRNLSQRAMPLGYEGPKGNLYLRQQISTYVKSLGIDCSPSSILVVSGALQALQLISIGLLHRGSTILLEKPSYLYSVHVFQSSGMKLFGVPLDEQGIQTSLIAQFKKQHNGALLYTIPSFHNPTGTLMSEKRRTQLMKVCENESLPIIEDDVYRDLWLDAPPPKPLKAFDKNGIVLYLGSMSKTVSPGLRIGWVIGPEPVIDRLADIKMQTDYGSSSLSQWAAAEWFSSGLYEEHIESVREQLKIRRETAIQALEKHIGDIATWTAPTGGFYIWVRLLPTISIRKLFEKALAEGILLNPGNIYDLHANQYLRLSYAYASLTDLTSGIEKLSILIRLLAVSDR